VSLVLHPHSSLFLVWTAIHIYISYTVLSFFNHHVVKQPAAESKSSYRTTLCIAADTNPIGNGLRVIFHSDLDSISQRELNIVQDYIINFSFNSTAAMPEQLFTSEIKD